MADVREGLGGRAEHWRARLWAEGFRHPLFRYGERVPSSALAHVSSVPPEIPSLGFSPIRLQGRHVRFSLPAPRSGWPCSRHARQGFLRAPGALPRLHQPCQLAKCGTPGQAVVRVCTYFRPLFRPIWGTLYVVIRMRLHESERAGSDSQVALTSPGRAISHVVQPAVRAGEAQRVTGLAHARAGRLSWLRAARGSPAGG